MDVTQEDFPQSQPPEQQFKPRDQTQQGRLTQGGQPYSQDNFAARLWHSQENGASADSEPYRQSSATQIQPTQVRTLINL